AVASVASQSEGGQVVKVHVRIGGFRQVEDEVVIAVTRGVYQREWGRRRTVQDVAPIDAALGQPRFEQSTEGIVGKATQKSHRNAQTPERDGRVVRATPWVRMKSVFVFDEVDQGFAGNSYHRSHRAAAGSISPEPRGTSWTGHTMCSDAE